MTEKQRRYKKALIRSIHCSDMYKNIYANDRDLYETMLKNRFGVTSSKELSIEELISLDRFVNKKDGLQIVPKKIYATKNQIAFIKSVWGANSKEKTLSSLLKIVSKVLKREVERLEDITKKEAGMVIAGIKNIKPAMDNGKWKIEKPIINYQLNKLEN